MFSHTVYFDNHGGSGPQTIHWESVFQHPVGTRVSMRFDIGGERYIGNGEVVFVKPQEPSIIIGGV